MPRPKSSVVVNSRLFGTREKRLAAKALILASLRGDTNGVPSLALVEPDDARRASMLDAALRIEQYLPTYFAARRMEITWENVAAAIDVLLVTWEAQTRATPAKKTPRTTKRPAAARSAA